MRNTIVTHISSSHRGSYPYEDEHEKFVISSKTLPCIMLRHVEPPPRGQAGIACSTDSSMVSNNASSSSTPLISPLASPSSTRAPTDIAPSAMQGVQNSDKRPAKLHKTKEVQTDPIPEKPEDSRLYFPQESMGAFLMQPNMNCAPSAAGGVPLPSVPPGTISFENGWYQAPPVQGHPQIFPAGYGSQYQNQIQFTGRKTKRVPQHFVKSREPYQPPPRLYIPRRDTNQNPGNFTNSQNKILGARSMNQNPISQSANGCVPSPITVPVHVPPVTTRGTRINRGFIPEHFFDQNAQPGRRTSAGGTMQSVGSYNGNRPNIGTGADTLAFSTSISDHRGLH